MQHNDFNDESYLPNMGGFKATASNYRGIHVEEEINREPAGPMNKIPSSNDWMIHSTLALLHTEARENKRREQRNRMLEVIMTGRAESDRTNETNSVLNAIKLYQLGNDMSKMNWLDASTLSNPTPASSPNVKISFMQKKPTLYNNGLNGQEINRLDDQQQKILSSASNAILVPLQKPKLFNYGVQNIPSLDRNEKNQEFYGHGANGLKKIDLLNSSSVSRQYTTPELSSNRNILRRTPPLEKYRGQSFGKSDMSYERRTDGLGTQMHTVDKLQPSPQPLNFTHRYSPPPRPNLFNYGVQNIPSYDRNENYQELYGQGASGLGSGMQNIDLLNSSSVSREYTTPESSSNRKLLYRTPPLDRGQRIKGPKQNNFAIGRSDTPNEQRTDGLGTQVQTLNKLPTSSLHLNLTHPYSPSLRPKLFNYGGKKTQSLERDQVQNPKEDIFTDRDKVFTERKENVVATNMEIVDVLKDSLVSNTPPLKFTNPKPRNYGVQEIQSVQRDNGQNSKQPDMIIDNDKVINEHKVTRQNTETPKMKLMDTLPLPKPLPISSQEATLEERRHIDKADDNILDSPPTFIKYGSKRYAQHMPEELANELKEYQKRVPYEGKPHWRYLLTGEVDRKQSNATPASSLSNLDDVSSPNDSEEKKKRTENHIGICHNQGVFRRSQRLMEKRKLKDIAASTASNTSIRSSAECECVIKNRKQPTVKDIPSSAVNKDQLDKVPIKYNKVSGIELLNNAPSSATPSTSNRPVDTNPSTSNEHSQHSKKPQTPTNKQKTLRDHTFRIAKTYRLNRLDEKDFEELTNSFLYIKTKDYFLAALRKDNMKIKLWEQKLNNGESNKFSPDSLSRYQARIRYHLNVQETLLREAAEPLDRKALRGAKIEFLHEALCETNKEAARQAQEKRDQQ